MWRGAPFTPPTQLAVCAPGPPPAGPAGGALLEDGAVSSTLMCSVPAQSTVNRRSLIRGRAGALSTRIRCPVSLSHKVTLRRAHRLHERQPRRAAWHPVHLGLGSGSSRCPLGRSASCGPLAGTGSCDRRGWACERGWHVWFKILIEAFYLQFPQKGGDVVQISLQFSK